MPGSKFSRFAFPLILLLLAFCTSGCYSLKTIPVDDFNLSLTSRRYLKVHSGDKTLLLEKYYFTGGILNGDLVSNAKGISRLSIIDLYIGGNDVVNIDGNKVTIPTDTIGKIDCLSLDGMKVLDGIFIFLAFLIYAPAFLQY